jgi:glucosamine kinase
VTQDIYIGVDGGATKCKVRVEDKAGNLLGQAVGGPANIRLSVDIAWQSIYQTIDDALRSHSISLRDKNYYFHLGLGLAGCEVQEARAAFMATPHSFSTLHLISDAHIACAGAHAGNSGAIIVIGTGVIGYQIQQGENSKVGGWGFPHDDMGGGAWLGLEAVRLTFQSLDHRLEKTPLLKEVFAFFDNDLNRFVTWANRATSHEFARLAPLVINHSQREEVWAVKLMKKAAHAVDRISVALDKMQQQKNERLPYCLFGGLAPFVEPWLSESLRSRIVQRQGDATAGAILLARQ